MFASSRQCSQRRRMGRGAQARRGAISWQRLTHLFSGGRGLRDSGSLRVPRSRGDKVCDPVTGEACPAREDCISADAAGRTTSERDAAIAREFHLSGRKPHLVRSWTKPRRVTAKVEWHPGELYPRVGFIVTNMSRPAERVVAFYNKRGTCEQWI